MNMECPQLRPYVRPVRSAYNSESVYLSDRLGIAEPFPLSSPELSVLEFFDGRHTLPEIDRKGRDRFDEEALSLAELGSLATRLDEGLLLDSPRFQKIVNDPVRPPRCIGCYEGEPKALRRQIRRLFTHERGAGLPRQGLIDGSLCAALIPHMDYHRGGLCYTFAFKELFEKADASLFVIIGTSHYSSARFTLTRKNFQTPLGTMPTDQEYIDRLVKHYGDGLFDDEWLAHFPEHSIELEVVFLQYLYEHVRPIRIVPLVVGSYHDCVTSGKSPDSISDISHMIDALKHVEEETKERVCYVISGDLAHIGPKFNPEEELDESLLERSQQQDQSLLQKLEAVDASGYFDIIAEEDDTRNICGLPPTFLTLAATKPRTGKVLRYDRYVHPQGHESVSFASAAFYR